MSLPCGFRLSSWRLSVGKREGALQGGFPSLLPLLRSPTENGRPQGQQLRRGMFAAALPASVQERIQFT